MYNSRIDECILKGQAFRTKIFLEERFRGEFAEVHARPLALAGLQVAATLYLNRASAHLPAGLRAPLALLSRRTKKKTKSTTKIDKNGTKNVKKENEKQNQAETKKVK